MRGLIKFLWCMFVVGSVQMVMGGNSASHTITIRVIRMNTFTLGQNEKSLLVSNTNGMENQNIQSEISSRHLNWMTDQRDKKITVADRTSSSNTKLQVEVVQCEGGDANRVIPVGDCDRDFISSMATSKGSCDLMYSVCNQNNVDSRQGFHEVVYTITDVF